MAFDYQPIIDKYYASGSALRQILMLHSEQVADLAEEINRSKQLLLDPDEVRAAAMLHDIGIFLTHAPGIECYGDKPYICHGLIGAELLEREHCPQPIARVAARHTGAGLTCDDIINQHLPLPVADYLPETMLEKLICYADKFYSKSGDMKRKSLEHVRNSMSRHGAATLERFDALNRLFG